MGGLLYYISILVLFFATIKSIFAIVSLALKGKVSGYLFVISVIIIFYIIPTFIETFFNIKFTDTYPEIQKALSSDNVNTFYNIYISIILFLFVRFAKKGHHKSYGLSYFNATGENLYKNYKKYNILIWILFLLPVIIIFIIGDLGYYSSYLARYMVVDIPDSHSIIDKLVLIGALLGVFIITSLYYKKRKNNNFIIHLVLFVLFVVFFYFWIHGKRSIVIIFFSALLTFMMITKAISIKSMKRLFLALLVSFLTFMSFYGKGTDGTIEEVYKVTRIDFGRDYGVKFAIYNDLLLDRHIVPSKLSSFIFTSTFFIPRAIWQNKPQPYAVYFTNSAFGNFGKDYQYGWGLTTSLIAESISNLGFLGLFIGPFIIHLILKKELKSTNPTFKLLSILIAILLLLLQIIAFMPIFLLYLWILLKENKKENSVKRIVSLDKI